MREMLAVEPMDMRAGTDTAHGSSRYLAPPGRTTFAANGRARPARLWCRHRWHRTSSTRDCRPPACWRKCRWPNTLTTCRCIARTRYLRAPAHSTLGQWKCLWHPVAAPVRGVAGGTSDPAGIARRRALCADAQTRPPQDPPVVPLELQ